MTNTDRMLAAIAAAVEPSRRMLDASDLVSCEVIWFKKPGGPDTVQLRPSMTSAVELQTSTRLR